MAGRYDKQNADYFTHENGMRNDKKLKAVRARFKNDGYAIYCMLLESLTEANLIMIEYSDVEIEMLAGDFGIDSDKLREMLCYFDKIKLIRLTKKFITCPPLEVRLKGIFVKRNKDLTQLRGDYCKINGISVSEIQTVKYSKEKKRKEEKSKEEKTLPVFFDNDVFKKCLKDFKEHRKTIKKPMTDRAEELLIEELQKLAGQDSNLAIKIMKKSIFSGWQGVFELKGEKTEVPPPKILEKIKPLENPLKFQDWKSQRKAKNLKNQEFTKLGDIEIKQED